MQEVQATVRDYMAMLQFELAGQAYNKTGHRRALQAKLQGRSEAAIELKHQNISAVLRDLGHFWIPGYKPRSNYQRILAQQVETWIGDNREFDRYALAAAEAPAAAPDVVDFASFLEEAPELDEGASAGVREDRNEYGEPSRVGRTCDYGARESRNSSLGLAGEELVLRFERFRLQANGRPRLADKVEHVSRTKGDGLGFDILSFDENGGEKFIEVKTTAFAKETPFFASVAEVRFAQRNEQRFELCRVFNFRKRPRGFTMRGRLQAYCVLDPITYRCAFS